MKKTLATLLVFAMVMSVCGMLFVSADEPVNLAAGKSYTTTAIFTTDGVQNWPDEGGVTLTDGVKAASDAGFSDPVWVGFNAQSADYDKAEGGYGATTVIDLGAVCDLDKIAFQAFGGDAGISTPYWINLYVSDDGENFTSAGYIENDPSKSPAGVSQFACDVDVSGRYVKVCFYLYGWGFIDEIEVFGTAAASAPEVEQVKPEAAIKLENTLAEKIVDSEDAAFNWDVEATVEGDKVTVVVTAKDMYELDSQIVFVDAWLRYNSNELVLLTADGKDGLECITSPDLSNKAWENASSAMAMPLADDADDFEKSFDSVVSMSVMTFEDGYCFTEESPVIFTLEFQFVEGVTVAGLFIDADESSCLDIDMSDVYCNGGYTVAYVPVEGPVTPPHTHEYTSAVTAEPTLSTEGVTTYTCECGDSYTEAIPAVKVQPDELVTLPEGALVLDNAGYLHGSFHCVIAGDNLTVSELTALGNNGEAKDMNYFYVIVVNAEGVVTETWFTLGRPEGVKTDVVCPAGGYIIGFNGNKADASALLDVKVGATVTLFNVDLDALRGAKGNVAVENAGITYVNSAPVENTKVEINVNENAILTDGKTGFTGNWGEVGTGDVVLVANGNCTAAGMDVTLSYALGEAKKINGVTIDLYHCAGVMIGYPEGQATVLVSVDGETWTEVGKYDLAAAEVATGAYGTVSSAFAFDEVEAAYVKVLLYAGSNADVLGENAADGKIFWEFISVAEVAVSEVTEPDEPDEPIAGGKDILVSHVNAYTWGVYNMMIITGEGQNSVSKLGYDCTWWIAIKVDNVDGVYTVTQIEGNGDAKNMTASADGFILYCYSNDEASFAAAQSVVVGDILLNSTVDWSQNAASETPIGTLTFGAAPSEPDKPSVEPSEPEEPSEDSSEVVVPPAGDAGILLFAILGVLAIAGAAVVIRVRN